MWRGKLIRNVMFSLVSIMLNLIAFSGTRVRMDEACYCYCYSFSSTGNPWWIIRIRRHRRRTLSRNGKKKKSSNSAGMLGAIASTWPQVSKWMVCVTFLMDVKLEILNERGLVKIHFSNVVGSSNQINYKSQLSPVFSYLFLLKIILPFSNVPGGYLLFPLKKKPLWNFVILSTDSSSLEEYYICSFVVLLYPKCCHHLVRNVCTYFLKCLLYTKKGKMLRMQFL